MGKLLLLFIAIPALELSILIELGRHLGTLPTLGIILFTGTLGAFLARRQGLNVLAAAQSQMRRGEIPAGSMADGVMILIAAALLITPGILTDATGFLLLVPAVRGAVKTLALRRIRKAVEENRLHVHVSGLGTEAPPFYETPGEPDPFDPESYPIHIDETNYKVH